MGEKEGILDYQRWAVYSNIIGVMEENWEQGLCGYLYKHDRHRNGVPLNNLYEIVQTDPEFQEAIDSDIPTRSAFKNLLEDLFWAEEVRNGPATEDISYRTPGTNLRFDALYAQHMRSTPETDGGHVPKYLANDDFYARQATNTLRNNGYEVVLTQDLSPEETAIVTVQEDVSHVLLPESYGPEDTSIFIDALDSYGIENCSLLQRTTNAESEDMLSEYQELPMDWESVDHVGPSTADTLENTDLQPWDIDEQELRRELVKAYGVRHGKSSTTRILNGNPHLFAEQDYTVPDRVWPTVNDRSKD